MLLVYVDDVLSVSHDAEATMKGIQGMFKLKGDKIEVPTHYLGTQVAQKVMDGHDCWTMTSEQYIKAIVNIETKLDKEGQRLPSRCLTPMKAGYCPEIDTSAELKKLMASNISKNSSGSYNRHVSLDALILQQRFHYCLLTLHYLALDICNRFTISLDTSRLD